MSDIKKGKILDVKWDTDIKEYVYLIQEHIGSEPVWVPESNVQPIAH